MDTPEVKPATTPADVSIVVETMACKSRAGASGAEGEVDSGASDSSDPLALEQAAGARLTIRHRGSHER